MKKENNIDLVRHSLSHLLAAAVLEMYPDAKPSIGPTIDNGFYYDFQFEKVISIEDLPKIEKGMRDILPHWETFKEIKVSADEAKKFFANNPYKLELIEEFEKYGQDITLYYSGPKDSTPSKSNVLKTRCSTLPNRGFIDLCRGGHAESLSKDADSDSWKLSRLAGAYWCGNEKNKMLTRIYGLAFNNKKDLAEYENQLLEAEKRDHRKLGKEMKLFTSSPLVGSGLPLLQPNGMVIRKEIEDYLWDLHKNLGYYRVWTPHIAKEELYTVSSHTAKFGEELFKVQGKEEKFIIKPMNCPHHMQIFADNQFSYRDMPVRYFEPATVYRDEKSGQLGGLTRVRAITQDDGHLFCRTSQIEEEVTSIIGVIKKFYATFGMISEYWISLSVRSPDSDKYLGTDEDWKSAEASLENAAKSNNLNYKRIEGEASFYGPKLDFMFKDAIGREWQLSTIQCDFNLPLRFALSFVNEKGEKERPVVIHRAISGSLERFMGILIEHYGGNFPLWLAPGQVKIIPVAEDHFSEAEKIHKFLLSNQIRSEIDLSNDSFGKKVRSAKISHTPYFIVLGEKDIKAKQLTLESRRDGKIGQLSLDELLKRLTTEIQEKR